MAEKTNSEQKECTWWDACVEVVKAIGVLILGAISIAVDDGTGYTDEELEERRKQREAAAKEEEAKRQAWENRSPDEKIRDLKKENEELRAENEELRETIDEVDEDLQCFKEGVEPPLKVNIDYPKI